MYNLKNKKDRYSFTKEIASEGITLLKNEDCCLPLGKDDKLAVFGRISYDTIFSGGGSAFCTSEYTVDIYTGLVNSGIKTDTELAEFYKEWAKNNGHPRFDVNNIGPHHKGEPVLSDEMVKNTKERGCNKALLSIGRYSSENDDSTYTISDYFLTPNEEKLIKTIKKYYDNIVVVFNRGNHLSYSLSSSKKVKAILDIYYPGMEGGNALGEIISGKTNPSGKLTDTVTYDYNDHPSSKGYGHVGGKNQIYTEDIYVGYRYFYTIPDAKKHVIYPFGYGLSYSSFEQKTIDAYTENGKVTVNVSVTNTSSKYSGKDVVMLYSSSPKGKIEKEKYRLVDFTKTKLLAPGESEIVELSVSLNDLGSFDEYGVTGNIDSFVLEKGTYKFLIGNDISKIKEVFKFENPKTKVISSLTHILSALPEKLTSSGKYTALECNKNFEHTPVISWAENSISAEYVSKSVNKEVLNAGESITFKLDVSANGLYTISSPDIDLFNTFDIIAGNKKISGSYESFIMTTISDWNFVTLKAHRKTLLKDFTLVFDHKEFYYHPLSEKDATIIEGGAFFFQSEYVISCPFNDKKGILKSGRSANRLHKEGRYVEYTVETVSGGVYSLSLRYQTESDFDSDTKINIYVNGERQFVSNVKFENTENGFKTSDNFYIRLEQGKNTITILSKAKDVLVISYLKLKKIKYKKLTPHRYEGDSEFVTIYPYTEPVVRKPNKELSEFDARKVRSGEISIDDFVSNLTDEELAKLTCANDHEWIGYLPNKGLGEVIWADGPNGLRERPYSNVLYPCSTIVASTWNKELAYKLGQSVSYDAHDYDIRLWLAPAMNIHRNPMCGRNFEYFSEDPYLSGVIAENIIKGVQENGIAACLKHFAANNTEYNRFYSNSIVSARALREIYFKGFENVFKHVQPAQIMTAYNYLNYKKIPENPLIINEVLRKELGFKNLLSTDYENTSIHVKELDANHNLKMIHGDVPSVVSALKSGELDRDKVRSSVKYLVNFVLKYTD